MDVTLCYLQAGVQAKPWHRLGNAHLRSTGVRAAGAASPAASIAPAQCSTLW